VRFQLDAEGVESLDSAEIAAILRGADMMIGRGGRTQLSRVLKGSREANLLEHGLDRCPSYGFYRDLTTEEILRRIDWTIQQDYLSIGYSGRLPVLVFTEKGWAIEIVTMADELLRGFDDRLAAGPPFGLSDLKDRDRGMIFLLLDKVKDSRRWELIPLLRAWEEIDYQKVQARIRQTIRSITSPDSTESKQA